MKVWIGVVTVTTVVLAGWYVFKKRGPTHPTIRLLKKDIAKIDPKLVDIPIYVGNSAYTENKTTIYICLKHPKTGEIYDMNTLMYVTLHEIAHVITDSYDEHGPKWRKNFTNLLNRAYKEGIYDPSKTVPRDYCGVNSY